MDNNSAVAESRVISNFNESSGTASPVAATAEIIVFDLFYSFIPLRLNATRA
jgi:hypothetical protein